MDDARKNNWVWGMTLACLILMTAALLAGFWVYEERCTNKESIASPDGTRILRIEKNQENESFVISECNPNGRCDSAIESKGTLLAAKWAKDGSKYIINRDQQGIKKLDVVNQKTGTVSDVNAWIKDAIYSELEQKHQKKMTEDAELSLEFQSWCDDNASMFLKYEVEEQGQVKEQGYVIWDCETNDGMEAIYEL